MNAHAALMRVVARVRRVRAMSEAEREAWRRDCAKRQQQHNCAFCKNYPDKCK